LKKEPILSFYALNKILIETKEKKFYNMPLLFFHPKGDLMLNYLHNAANAAKNYLPFFTETGKGNTTKKPAQEAQASTAHIALQFFKDTGMVYCSTILGMGTYYYCVVANTGEEQNLIAATMLPYAIGLAALALLPTKKPT